MATCENENSRILSCMFPRRSTRNNPSYVEEACTNVVTRRTRETRESAKWTQLAACVDWNASLQLCHRIIEPLVAEAFQDLRDVTIGEGVEQHSLSFIGNARCEAEHSKAVGFQR